MKKITVYVSEDTEKVIEEIISLTRMKRTEIYEVASKKLLEALNREGYNLNKIKI